METSILHYTPELLPGWAFYVRAGQDPQYKFTVAARATSSDPLRAVHCRTEEVAAFVQNHLTLAEDWMGADKHLFFRTEPYVHQLVDWCETRDLTEWGVLYEMGAGKSKAIIDAAAWQYERGMINGLVVIAPKGCYQDWKDEHVPNHLPTRIARRHEEWVADPSKTRQAALREVFEPVPGRLNILSINVESLLSDTPQKLLRYFLTKHKAMLAIDESTTIGNPKAQRTKVILGDKKKPGLRDLAVSRRIATGDATPDSPLSIWSQAEALKQAALGYGDFYSFKTTFCHLVPRYAAGGRTFQSIDESQGDRGYRNLDLLRERINSIAIIVKKEDCLDLPPKIYAPPRVIEMGPKQKKAYDSMKQLSVAFIEEVAARIAEGAQGKVEELADTLSGALRMCLDCGHEFADAGDCPCCGSTDIGVPELACDPSKMSTASLAVVQSLRLHQIACGFIINDMGVAHGFDETNPRLEALMEELEEAPKGKVGIWTCYRRNIDEISKAIAAKYGKDSVATYYGDTKHDARREFKLSFQDSSSPLHYGVLNIANGRYGLTLTAGKVALYYADTYHRDSRAQSEDRFHRIGQDRSVLYKDFVARGTVDERFLPIRLGKQALSEAITPSNWKKFLGAK